MPSELSEVPLLRGAIKDDALIVYILENDEQDWRRVWWPQVRRFAAVAAPTAVGVIWQAKPDALLVARGANSELSVGREVLTCGGGTTYIRAIDTARADDRLQERDTPADSYDAAAFVTMAMDVRIDDGDLPALREDGNDHLTITVPGRSMGHDYRTAIVRSRPELLSRVAEFSSFSLPVSPSESMVAFGKDADGGVKPATSSTVLRWFLQRLATVRPSAAGRVVVWRRHDVKGVPSDLQMYQKFGDRLVFADATAKLDCKTLAGARALIVVANKVTKGDTERLWHIVENCPLPMFVVAEAFDRNVRDRAVGSLIRTLVLPEAEQAEARRLILDELVQRCVAIPANPCPAAARKVFRDFVAAARDNQHVVLQGKDAAQWWSLVTELDFSSMRRRPLTAPELASHGAERLSFDEPPSAAHAANSAARTKKRVVRLKDGETLELKSTAMDEVFTTIESILDVELARRDSGTRWKRGRSNFTCLILGESGVGKQSIADYISFRIGGPFITVNCAAIPETLLESELFGYEKGAFTDAKNMKRGLAEEADGGVLFLDEIGDMPLALQVKVLHLIQDRWVRRVGGNKQIPVTNLAVVAATNRDLYRAIAQGEFRSDLYYRLGNPIRVPPLRHRIEDIEPLLEGLVIDRHAQDALRKYDYPGNFRELREILAKASARSVHRAKKELVPEGHRITFTDLPLELQHAWARSQLNEGGVPHLNAVLFANNLVRNDEAERLAEEVAVGSIRGVRLVIAKADANDSSILPVTGRRIPIPDFKTDWTDTDRVAFAEFVLRGGTITADSTSRLQRSELYAHLSDKAKTLIKRAELWHTANELEDDLVYSVIEVVGAAVSHGGDFSISDEMLTRANHRRPPIVVESGTAGVTPEGRKRTRLRALTSRALRDLKDPLLHGRIELAITATKTLPSNLRKSNIIQLLKTIAGVGEAEARAAVLFLFNEARKSGNRATRGIQILVKDVFRKLDNTVLDDQQAESIRRNLANFIDNRDFELDEQSPHEITTACDEFRTREAQITVSLLGPGGQPEIANDER